MREKNFHTEPFTNFYPIGGGGWVIADPKLKEIPKTEAFSYHQTEKNVLASAEKSDPSDSSWDYGAGPVATISSPPKSFS